MAVSGSAINMQGREASIAREFALFEIGEVLKLGASGTELTVRRIDRRDGYVVTEVTKLVGGDNAKKMYLNQSIRLAPTKSEGRWAGLDGPSEMDQLYLLIQAKEKLLGTVAALYS